MAYRDENLYSVGKSTDDKKVLYLEHSDESLRKAVEGTARLGLIGKVKLSSKDLHAQQGEDDNKEEEEEEQAGDRAHGVQERSHQITERCPVSGKHNIFTFLTSHLALFGPKTCQHYKSVFVHFFPPFFQMYIL